MDDRINENCFLQQKKKKNLLLRIKSGIHLVLSGMNQFVSENILEWYGILWNSKTKSEIHIGI